MKTPLNTETLKHHLTYSWWKYVLCLVAGIFLVNLAFTMTEPRVPEDRRVDFYVYGYANETSLDAYMEQVRRSDLPDMESMTSTLYYQDATYGPMQLAALVAAREGDVFLLPRDEFSSFSSAESFIALEGDGELMAIFNEAGVDLRRGWRTLPDSDDTHLYGIPLDALPGLNALCYAENGFLSVTSYGGNLENTMKFFRILCRDMISAPEDAEEAAGSD